jgi:hypothetical protein
MLSTNQNSGTALTQSLVSQSEREAAVTPMDTVLDAAGKEALANDQYFRLTSHLWNLKRQLPSARRQKT